MKQQQENFKTFIRDNELKINADSKIQLVTFAEMDEKSDTPEITTECWKILNKIK